MDVTIAFKKKVTPDSSRFFKLSAKAISWWTKSEYYHCELIIDKKWISSHPNLGGVAIRDLKPLSENWDYYKLDLPELTEEQQMVLWTYIYKQLDTGYDWKGIFLSQFFKFGLNADSKWFCSEIVAKLLQLYIS